MKWTDDLFKQKDSGYNHKWRKGHKVRYLKTQMKWYYKFRPRILRGWRKPESQNPDEFDVWYEKYGLSDTGD